MTRHRILVVEDDALLRVSISDRLASEGYDSQTSDGADVLERASRERWDLIVLDWMLPGRSGLEICEQLRRQSVFMPILMLTARGDLTDKVLAFKLGADDYVTKPFAMAELLARIEVLLRRWSRVTGPDIVRIGEAEVDLRRGTVTNSGVPVPISGRELQLLRYLVAHRGELLTREELLKNVWSYGEEIFTRTVDVHMATLRRKLEPDPRRPRYLLTAKNIGYKLDW